jgi:hypothetical protein
LIQSHLFILSLRCWAFQVPLRKLFHMTLCSIAFQITSCSYFKISGLILRFFIHFELIWYRDPLHADIQFSQQHLLKRLSFLHHVIKSSSYPLHKGKQTDLNI